MPSEAPAHGRQRQDDYLSQIFPANRDNTAESNRTSVTFQACLWGTVQDCRLRSRKSPATLAQHWEDKGRPISVYLRPGRIHAEILSQKSANSKDKSTQRLPSTDSGAVKGSWENSKNDWFEWDSSWKQLEIDIIMERFASNPIFSFFYRLKMKKL